MKKTLIIIGVVVAVLVIGLAILAANLDKVVNSKKDYILDRAETALGRKITIEDIGVTIGFGIGVKLSGVTVADDPDFSSDPFVAAKDLTIKVKLWPLIRKQVEVKRLVLNEPVINLIRDERGVFNFAGMAADSAGGVAPAPGEPEKEAATAALALAFADIEGGTIRFVDRQGGLELDVRQFDFTAKDAALGKEASLDLRAAVMADEQNVHIEGTVGPVEKFDTPEDLRPTPLKLTATLSGVSLAELQRAIPDHPALAKLSLLDLESVEALLEVTGTLGALSVSSAKIDAAVLGAADRNVSVVASVQPFDALTAGEGAPVAVNGRVEASALPLGGLREKADRAGLAQMPPELAVSGDANLAVQFDGSPASMSLQADIDLAGAAIRFADQFDKPSGVPMGLSCRVSAGPAVTEIEKCTITAGALVLEALGSVDLGAEAPDLDVTVQVAPTDIGALAGMLPALEPFSPTGTLGLRARASGQMAPGEMPDVQGELTLNNGGAKLAQLPQPVTDAVATVKFTERTARVEKASAKVGRSSVQLTATAASLEPFDATYRLWSSEVHRSDFNVPPKPAPRPEVLKGVEVEGKLWREGETVRHEGKATSTSGTVANLDYTDLSASIGSTQSRLEVPHFSAKTLGGTVEGNGAFVTGSDPPRFEVTTRVRSVNLTEYFSYKVKSLPQFIEGTIDLDLDLAGTGKEWEAIKPTLSGQGGAVVVRGSLLNVNVANELLNAVSQLPLVDQNAVARVRQNNPKLFSGNNSAFKDLKGDIRIEGGRIHSKGLVLQASEYSVYGQGWVSLDRQLEFNTTIVLSPSATAGLARDLSAIKYLTNDKGQLVIPLTWSGVVTNPTLSPDIDALAKKLQESAVDAGVDKLRDQFGDEVSDFLKGFGKKSTAKGDSTGRR